MFKELNTLDRSTVTFNPEFTRVMRHPFQQKFKQMSLEYDPSSKTAFDCNSMLLSSLEGAPQKVVGSFDCSNNQLTSLKDAPQKVVGSFYCYDNHLTSLKGAPQSVGGSFYCRDNHLTSLKGAPQSVGRHFLCHDNQKLTSLEGAPQYVGRYFYCDNNPKLSKAQIDHYKEFLKGEHQECLVDGHYMPPDSLRGEQNV